jgi:hypothetical protein
LTSLDYMGATAGGAAATAAALPEYHGRVDFLSDMLTLFKHDMNISSGETAA